MSTRLHLRPGGAQGCSHGWSDAALSIAQPVDPMSLVNPAPEGRRSPPARAKNSAAPPGRMNPSTRLPRVAPAKRGLHPWLHPGVPSGRETPPCGCSNPAPHTAAHFLRSSPGLPAPAPSFRGVSRGLRGAAPLPSGLVGRPSDLAGRSSGSLVASANSPGRSSGPAVASAGSSGRPSGPPGRPAKSSGRRDRSSVASADSLVAWRRRAPEPPPRSRLWPFRGVAGGPPPASADRSRPPSRPSRRRTRQHS